MGHPLLRLWHILRPVIYGAAAALGTTGIRPTVEAALDEVLRLQAWDELQELLANGAVELSHEEMRRQAWRE
jgi:hypothetical protein